ncbi:Hypothetical predicted protein, partial [Pelobates cultripes]
VPMENKKKTRATQDYLEQGSSKKSSDLDRYLQEKVKALAHNEDSNMAVASQDSESPPHSPAFSD